MLKKYLTDLHIHSCLSPCTEIEMLPAGIIETAKNADLHAIGIADHNSAENAAVTKELGEKAGINVIMGMEITTAEEVHILAYFEKVNELMAMQDLVHKNLPGKNDEEKFGRQIIVDDEGNPAGYSEKLLIGATTLPIEKIITAIHELNGLAIASHIDRESFGILGQLGFIPEGLKLDAVELSNPPSPFPSPQGGEGGGEGTSPFGFPVITSSDAHYLADIGKNVTHFQVEEITVKEITMALHGEKGRTIKKLEYRLKHLN